MLETLKNEYVEFLKVNGLLERLFGKVIESSAHFYEDAWAQKCLLSYNYYLSVF